MRYFKLFVIWVGYLTLVTLLGEYVISREVNGFLQLLSVIGLVGFTIGVFTESEKSNHTKEYEELLKSLQTTEWDVEITTEPHHNGELINDGTTHPIEVTFKPVLDENGCLILKKINYE